MSNNKLAVLFIYCGGLSWQKKMQMDNNASKIHLVCLLFTVFLLCYTTQSLFVARVWPFILLPLGWKIHQIIDPFIQLSLWILLRLLPKALKNKVNFFSPVTNIARATHYLSGNDCFWLSNRQFSVFRKNTVPLANLTNAARAKDYHFFSRCCISSNVSRLSMKNHPILNTFRVCFW